MFILYDGFIDSCFHGFILFRYSSNFSSDIDFVELRINSVATGLKFLALIFDRRSKGVSSALVVDGLLARGFGFNLPDK